MCRNLGPGAGAPRPCGTRRSKLRRAHGRVQARERPRAGAPTGPGRPATGPLPMTTRRGQLQPNLKWVLASGAHLLRQHPKSRNRRKRMCQQGRPRQGPKPTAQGTLSRSPRVEPLPRLDSGLSRWAARTHAAAAGTNSVLSGAHGRSAAGIAACTRPRHSPRPVRRLGRAPARGSRGVGQAVSSAVAGDSDHIDQTPDAAHSSCSAHLKPGPTPSARRLRVAPHALGSDPSQSVAFTRKPPTGVVCQ